MQLVGPATDGDVLVASRGTVATEVHDVVATFAIALFVERHPGSISVCAENTANRPPVAG